MILFMQKVIICEPGSFNPVGTILDRVGTDALPDHMLACDGSAYKRKLFDPHFVKQMRPFTSWWRWHLFGQFRVPVFEVVIGADLGEGDTQIRQMTMDEYIGGTVGNPRADWDKIVESDPVDDLKNWVKRVESAGIPEPLPYQERIYGAYFDDKPADIEQTMMIPRRDPRYDKRKPKSIGAKIKSWFS